MRNRLPLYPEIGHRASPLLPRRPTGQFSRRAVTQSDNALGPPSPFSLLSVHVPPLKISLTLRKQDFAGAGH